MAVLEGFAGLLEGFMSVYWVFSGLDGVYRATEGLQVLFALL